MKVLEEKAKLMIYIRNMKEDLRQLITENENFSDINSGLKRNEHKFINKQEKVNS